MKTKDLIKLLRECNPDADVKIRGITLSQWEPIDAIVHNVDEVHLVDSPPPDVRPAPLPRYADLQGDEPE